MLSPFAQTTDNTFLNNDFWQEQPLLQEHLRFVLRHNAQVNLTGVADLESGKVIHIEDSLAALPEIQSAPAGDLADIGSGAGYPGIPLALCTGRKTLLIEATQKKAVLLAMFIRKQGLSDQIAVAAERSERVAERQGARFSVVTARAVGSLAILVELAAPLLQMGGFLVAFKGPGEPSEEEGAVAAAEIAGMTWERVRELKLSDGRQRRIYTFRKVGESLVKLPRRPGMAAKRRLTFHVKNSF